jgi:hypothetical protein
VLVVNVKVIDLKWKEIFFFTCSHYGNQNSRAQGIRPNQKVYSADCKFVFRVVFQARMFKIQPQKFHKTHTNHVNSIELFKLYANERSNYIKIHYIMNSC